MWSGRRRRVTDQRVLFFGDSFTTGVGDPTGLGWVGRVVATSFDEGLPLTAYNLGVRRETSVDVAARLLAEIAPRLLDSADCRIVLCVGANDTTEEDGQTRAAHARSVETLTHVLTTISEMGLPAFVIGPGAIGGDQLQRIHLLSQAFGGACAALAVPFVPVVEALVASSVWLTEAAQGDGAHPAAGGYEEFARVVLNGGWIDWLRAKP
jgi:acyl-CoA thioesterase-1